MSSIVNSNQKPEFTHHGEYKVPGGKLVVADLAVAGERIERARRLLCQTDMRVNEIAASVGIDNANYFSILFKKLTGKTPMQVRDEAKKQNREEKSRNQIV